MFDKKVLRLFVLFIFLNVMDVVTTLIGLQLGAAESNPTILTLMARMGILEALLLKFFVVLFLGLVSLVALWYAKNHEPKSFSTTRRVVLATLAVGSMIYVFIVVNNVNALILQALY